jgi:hypothetical protein
MIIQAALRFYRRMNGPADEILMRARVEAFLAFSLEQLEMIRTQSTYKT